MLKKILAFSFLVLFLCQPIQEAFAIEIEWAHVFRDNRVYEPGDFIGVTDRDGMGASAAVDVGASNPDDYEVYLTSSSSGPVDIYLTKYRDLGGGSWEYVNPTSLAPPSVAWENVTYTFQLVDASTKVPVGVPVKTWNIYSGDVTNPDPVPIPNWVALSGDCSSLHIEWEDVLGNLGGPPYTGHYSIRVYLVEPDGSLNYASYSYQFGKWADPEKILPVSLCGDFCQSWAIGIQSRINVTGADPLGGGLVNRSQYYFKYGPTPTCTNIDIDIKPGSDPNCFNNNGHGVIPVAILGSDTFDVSQIDVGSVSLEGMSVKTVGKADKSLAHIEDVNGDGFDDLVVQILDEDGIFDPGIGEALVTGQLLDGSNFEGSDFICVTQ